MDAGDDELSPNRSSASAFTVWSNGKISGVIDTFRKLG